MSRRSQHQQQSIRFAPEQRAWLSDATRRSGESINAVVRQLVDDAQTFFGLSPSILALLQQDRVAMGLDHRGYVRELLTRRYRDLLLAQFDADADAHQKR